MRDVAFDFLSALNQFYMSTLDEEASNDIDVMTALMNHTNRLNDGIQLLSKYKKHRNEMIRLAAQGSILGAEMVTAANSYMISTLRHPHSVSPDELRYRIAACASKQREGYATILKSAPWITAVMFTVKEKEEQVGPVAYTISRTDRKEILDMIERMFGSEIAAEERGERKDNHNLVVGAAMAMKRNLDAETYEELHKRLGHP